MCRNDRVLVDDAGRAPGMSRASAAPSRAICTLFILAIEICLPPARAPRPSSLAEPPAEELGLGDLGDHPDEASCCTSWKGADRLLVELDALLGVLERPVVAAHPRPRSPPTPMP